MLGSTDDLKILEIDLGWGYGNISHEHTDQSHESGEGCPGKTHSVETN